MLLEGILWVLVSCRGEAGCLRTLAVLSLNRLRLLLLSPVYTCLFSLTHTFLIVVASAFRLVHLAHMYEHKLHQRMHGVHSPLESHKDFVSKGKYRPRKFVMPTTS